jgi:hypothetical protein
VKIHRLFGGKRILWHWLLVVAILVSIPVVAKAATIISESYISSDKLPPGSIVSLKKGSTDHVEAASTSNSSYILGVVIDGANSQLSFTSEQSNEVHVGTNGVQPVLVSDINGSIAVGDPVTSSPIKSVGMKATDNIKIVGVAQEAFPNGSATKGSYKDQKGQQQTVKLGQISVLVNVSYYYKQPDKTIIPSAVQNVADALAGKKVNALPILISIGIFIMSMVVVMSIVFSMIRSSIISVGRNPMSQAAVYRNVIQLSSLARAISPRSF